MEDNKNINETNLPEEGASNAENKNEELAPQAEVVKTDAEENAAPVQEEVVAAEGETPDAQDEQKAEEVVAEGEGSAEPEADGEGKVEHVGKPEKSAPVEEQLPKEDYAAMARLDLITKLNDLLNRKSVEVIKDAVEEIKVQFYKKLSLEKEEALSKFVEEGGVAEDFKFVHDNSEDTFKELYDQYRQKKISHAQVMEQEKKTHLKEKYEIIEEIAELINKEESINKTFQEFRDLQKRWHEVGLVPQSDMKGLWEHYNHTVEKFYDYIKINKELRDLDLKKNLEEKIGLCEKAERLLLEESVTKAFKTLQDYHDKWREIGPVPRDQKDDIWDRFKAVTTQINKKHQAYFDGLKEQQVKNLEEKEALCEKVEELISQAPNKPKEWEDLAHEIVEIQKLWRTIGFAPKKDNNKIYQRFKDACDSFFNKKRDFYKQAKSLQKNNMQLKLDIIMQAEALKDSVEWKKTSDDLIQLQKKWKQVGPVPKKQSEALWKRFRAACDHFFNAKAAFFNTVDSKQEDNLQLKLDLIEKIKKFEKTGDDKETLDQLIALQKEWSDIGYVPLNKKDEIQKEYRDAINAQFEKLKIEGEERNKLNFQTKVDTWVHSKSKGKLYAERNKLVTKIKELENEISVYENNIGFFASSDKSNKMIDGITRKIEDAKTRMDTYKEKLRMLDQADEE